MKRSRLKEPLPSLNGIIDASKLHWAAYHEMKSTYTNLVAVSCSDIQKMNHVDVEIRWYCKNRRMDPDNAPVAASLLWVDWSKRENSRMMDGSKLIVLHNGFS